MSEFNLEYNVQNSEIDAEMDSDNKEFDLNYEGGGSGGSSEITKEWVQNEDKKVLNEAKQTIKNHTDKTNNPHQTKVSNLADVVLTDVQDGEVLKYDAEKKKFVNGEGGSGGGVSKDYVDRKDAETLSSAKAYAEAQDEEVYNGMKEHVATKLQDYDKSSEVDSKINNEDTKVKEWVNNQGFVKDLSAYRTKNDQDVIDNAIKEDVNNIKKVIPNEATETNQVATEGFVNSSISKMSANKVCYNAHGDNFPSRNALLTATIFYHKGVEYTPSKNDYAFVDVDEAHDNKQAHYTYDEGFTFDYTMGSTFTQKQQKAIDSGATEELINQITTNKENITSLSQDLGETKTALAQAQSDIRANHEQITSINTMIPEGATSQNKFADRKWVQDLLASDKEIFKVVFTADSEGHIRADKTSTEIFQAIALNKFVFGAINYSNENFLFAVNYSNEASGEIVFGYVDGEDATCYELNIQVKEGQDVITYNPRKLEAGAYIVKITGDESGYHIDKTCQEIFEAFTDNKIVKGLVVAENFQMDIIYSTSNESAFFGVMPKAILYARVYLDEETLAQKIELTAISIGGGSQEIETGEGIIERYEEGFDTPFWDSVMATDIYINEEGKLISTRTFDELVNYFVRNIRLIASYDNAIYEANQSDYYEGKQAIRFEGLKDTSKLSIYVILEESGETSVEIIETPLVPKYFVEFNGNGGTPEKQFIERKIGEKIGTLPQCEGGDDLEFIGWFSTIDKGGRQITEDDIVAYGEMVIYARWINKAVYYTQDSANNVYIYKNSGTGRNRTTLKFNSVEEVAWNVSNVVPKITFVDFIRFDEKLSYLFTNCQNIIISEGIDTLNVSDFSYLFNGYLNNTINLSMLSIDTTNATNVEGMFNGASANTINITAINTSNVVNMKNMFADCSNVNQLDVSVLDTANVLTMEAMFKNCVKVIQLTLSSFNTDKVNNMASMFEGCESVRLLNLTNVQTISISRCEKMFKGCKLLTEIIINDMVMNGALSLESMFEGCESLEEINFPHIYGGEQLTSLEKMFKDCKKAKVISVPNINSINVISMVSCYENCESLESLEFLEDRKWQSFNVISMANMFKNCKSLITFRWNTFYANDLESMESLFENCENLTNLSIHENDCDKVKYYQRMYKNCKNLPTIPMLCYNVSGINFEEMFENCEKLQSVYLAKVHVPQGVKANANRMFHNCLALTTIYDGYLNFYENKIEEDENMFLNCLSLVGGNGTAYTTEHIGKKYAMIDQDYPRHVGYFTNIH